MVYFTNYTLFNLILYNHKHNCDKLTKELLADPTLSDKTIGIIYLTLSLLFIILYVPFLFVMFKKEQFKLSAIKLMIVLGFCDIYNLVFAGIFSGVAQMNGFVYCTAPILNYFVGSTIMGCWMTICSLAVVLAVDRCLSVIYEKLQVLLFEGRRVYIWIAMCVLEGVLFSLFTAPVFYNGHLFTYYIDPYVTFGFSDEEEYSNNILNINNIGIGIVLFITYIIFSTVFVYKLFVTNQNTLTPSLKNPIFSLFCTVFVYSTFLTASSILYVISQKIPVSRLYLISFNIIGIITYGINGVIYMLLNPSLRNAVFELKVFKLKKNTITQVPRS